MTSPMTPLEFFEGMRWTWHGPTEVREEDGAYFEMRIVELPGFFVAGETADEVQRERGEALRTYLASYVDRGEVPPIRETWVIVMHEAGSPPSAEGNAGMQPLHLTRIAG